LELHNQLGVVQLSSEENQSEMEICKKRESELLLLTQKMTERNAELQSANSVLNSKVSHHHHKVMYIIALLQDGVKKLDIV